MNNSLSNADHDVVWGILENFDFDRVHNVMTYLGWCWASTRDPEGNSVTDVPTLDELRSNARSRMIAAAEWLRVRGAGIDYRSVSGGFEVQAHIDDDGSLRMELQFVLTSWDNGE
jgi:hypothetical protein